MGNTVSLKIKINYSVILVIPVFFLLTFVGCYNKSVKRNFDKGSEISEQYRIALFPLHTLTENIAEVKDEVEDELTAYFLNSNLFILLERKMIDTIMEEMKLQVSDLMDISTSVEIGRLIGAQFIIVGSISSYKKNLILSARIVDVETGRIMAISTGRNKFSKIQSIVNETAGTLLKGFMSKVE